MALFQSNHRRPAVCKGVFLFGLFLFALLVIGNLWWIGGYLVYKIRDPQSCPMQEWGFLSTEGHFDVEIPIQVKRFSNSDWADAVLSTAHAASKRGRPLVVAGDGMPYGPGEVYAIRGVDQGAVTQGMLNKADDAGYIIHPGL